MRSEPARRREWDGAGFCGDKSAVIELGSDEGRRVTGQCERKGSQSKWGAGSVRRENKGMGRAMKVRL